MRLLLATVSTGAFAAGVLASAFEPADFNVTKALLDSGVSVTAIPGLAGLVERSSTDACSIAVRLSNDHDSLLGDNADLVRSVPPSDLPLAAPVCCQKEVLPTTTSPAATGRPSKLS